MPLDMVFAGLGVVISFLVMLGGVIAWTVGRFDLVQREIADIRDKYVRRDDNAAALGSILTEINQMRPRMHQLAGDLQRLTGQLELLNDRQVAIEKRSDERHRENLEHLTAIRRRIVPDEVGE